MNLATFTSEVMTTLRNHPEAAGYSVRFQGGLGEVQSIEVDNEYREVVVRVGR